jgi:hypothetical protein
VCVQPQQRLPPAGAVEPPRRALCGDHQSAGRCDDGATRGSTHCHRLCYRLLAAAAGAVRYTPTEQRRGVTIRDRRGGAEAHAGILAVQPQPAVTSPDRAAAVRIPASGGVRGLRLVAQCAFCGHAFACVQPPPAALSAPQAIRDIQRELGRKKWRVGN